MFDHYLLVEQVDSSDTGMAFINELFVYLFIARET
jgi:hypothetical protein